MESSQFIRCCLAVAIGSYIVTLSYASPATQTTGDLIQVPANPARISVSDENTCIISVSNDTIYCCGDNYFSQLGTTTQQDNSTVPVPPNAFGSTFQSISTRSGRTCGVTTAGRILCWGSNSDSFLGVYSTENEVRKPSEIKNGDSKAWDAVSVGDYTICAIDSIGDAYCWGSNEYNILGDAASEYNRTDATAPRKVALGNDTSDHGTWVQISTALFHVCGVKSDATGWCWGGGEEGKIGNNSTAGAIAPVQVSGGYKWKQFSTARDITCGTQVDDSAWCFGAAEVLGTGQTTSSSIPVRINSNEKFLNVAVSEYNACGITINHALLCWGRDFGSIPTQLTYDVDWELVDVGDYYTVAMKQDGTVWSWGENNNGGMCIGSDDYYPNSSLETSSEPLSVVGFQQPYNIQWTESSATNPPTPNNKDTPSSNNGKTTPPPTNNGTTSDTSSSSSSNTAAIVGGIVGGIAALALILAVVYFVYKRKKGNTATPAKLSTISSMQHALPPPTTKQSIAHKNVTATTIDFLVSPPTRPIDSLLLSNPDDKLLQYIASVPSSAWASSTATSSTGATTTTNSSSMTSHLSSSRTRGTVDISPWEIQFNELQVLERLGAGSFGAVYRAMWNGTPVALKILLDVTNPGADSMEAARLTQDKLMKEASLTAALRHPNIVSLLGVCFNPPCVALELCTNGSLFELLQQAGANPEKAKELTWKRRLNILIDGARGMIYLHTRHPQILHRDLKSPNIMITGVEHTGKIADFGLSKIVQEVTHQTSISTAEGASNPRWLAPEVFQTSKATAASDVYSWGVIMWEVLVWQVPYSTTANPWMIVSDVMAGKRLAIPAVNELPGPDKLRNLDGYIDLMTRCWAQNPDDRPTFQQVLAALE